MREKFFEKILLLCALSAVTALFLIALFIFYEGLPLIFRIGPANFILSSNWAPTKGHFGILPMIVGSLQVTVLALILGGTLGLACAMFLAEFAPRWSVRILKPLIELLAGIPSVVYGFIGVLVLVPLIRRTLGGPGFSVLAAGIILGIMILPTVIAISLDALNAVPLSYKEGSLAVGATRWQTLYRLTLPAAKSGIIASLILAMGRAIGETMAVIMVAGNALIIPKSPLEPVRTLTSNIALEMGYASGTHQEALFATGVVLFIIVALLNTFALLALRKKV
ncbi:MAG: phosphate ABC transporter permease subunit PstC [candidate division WOR-3 bacterium]|jgi:phosphate ABC transporter permease protein PstC|nr:phosphate ABC transporter permease subunit PstC [candidate division WOR-3 bacterium]MCR4423716.1 phosphate ABC transporter permease subunit PstC [candidate division WOR-3 bacterium]MDH7519055.1 phosphate ABC transporter permease subunit PstC [bacterium]